MPGQRGWVSVSVQTYQSHRTSAQRITNREYTVDETGATLAASSRDAPEEEPEQQPSTTPTSQIVIRDWKLHGRRAYIRYEREDSSFWFNPVMNDEQPRHSSASGSEFPCSRGDIFLKLGMRGARLIPWQLKEGDVFRLGQAYVLVSKVRLTSDTEMDLSAFAPKQPAGLAVSEGVDSARDSLESGAESDDEFPPTPGSQRRTSSAPPPPAQECYICYEAGAPDNPLISPCMCQGSVQFVHLNCLQRWIQPEGSSAVNTHCSICKAKYPEKAQAMMIRPPALLLESWSNHRSQNLKHWVSFAAHGTAALGRFTEHNDVVIPDHSVSGEHGLIIHDGDQFWLHDRESSNGTFIRLSAPLKLAFGEVLQMKMGKSLLSLQAKRSRWSRLRMRLNLLRLGADRGEEDASGRNSSSRNSGDRDCVTPALAPRTSRDEVREVAPGEMEPHP